MASSTDLKPPPRALLDGACLFLDFDGTLVELADRPDAVAVDEGLAALLDQLATKLGDRVALVSGRSVAQLDRFLGDSSRRVAVVGSHGAESRHVGKPIARPDRPEALDAAQTLIVESFGGRDGVVIEEKSLGVGVHYRLDPAVEEEAHALAAKLAQAHDLEVQKGKMMVELRLPGHDKGSAIAAMLGEAPFNGCRPVFIGDDLTDEPGFAACAKAGGAGVLVGTPRETAASYRLANVAAVREWLAEAAR